ERELLRIQQHCWQRIPPNSVDRGVQLVDAPLRQRHQPILGRNALTPPGLAVRNDLIQHGRRGLRDLICWSCCWGACAVILTLHRVSVSMVSDATGAGSWFRTDRVVKAVQQGYQASRT